MSYLAHRSSRRKMSRPNARKALHRIEKELLSVVNAAPAVFGSIGWAREKVWEALDAARSLFADPPAVVDSSPAERPPAGPLRLDQAPGYRHSRCTSDTVRRWALARPGMPAVDFVPEERERFQGLPVRCIWNVALGNFGRRRWVQYVFFDGRWLMVAQTTLVDDVGTLPQVVTKADRDVLSKLLSGPVYGFRVSDNYLHVITKISDG